VSSYELSSHDVPPRTLKQEFELWRAWRDSSPAYQRRRGWDHNNPIFGILGFAYERGWIQTSILYVIVAFMLELFCLIPISLTSSAARLLLLDFVLMVTTLFYLCYRLWSCSKLLFVSVIPIFLACIGFALLLWFNGAA
jgi:hypothetical protein